MNIVCGIDDNFVQHCGVLMVSIFENNRNESIHFHIITSGISSLNRRDLQEICKQYNQHFYIHGIDRNLMNNCPLRKGDHISLAAYNRILIPEILPKEMNKCLYLDADIIVDGVINEMYNIDLGNKSTGVIIDQSTDDIRHYNRLKYSRDKGYFNSGVLLFNLKIWRDNELTRKCLDYILENKGNLLFHDQDALNFVLKDSTFFLPLKYNVQYSFFFKNPMITNTYWAEMYYATRHPVIIHYTNKLKPWHISCQHPYKQKYVQYKKLTKWKNTFLKSYSIKTTLDFLRRMFLRFISGKKCPPYVIREEFHKLY